jgi:hypothetical protein
MSSSLAHLLAVSPRAFAIHADRDLADRRAERSRGAQLDLLSRLGPDRIVASEGGHVEDISDRHSTPEDAAVSPELAAVEIVWCKTDERGYLLAAHLPEFWQQGDERKGQHRADAWHRGQQVIEPSESSIGPAFFTARFTLALPSLSG